MPEKERQAGEWRYWQAVALAKTGRQEEGQVQLESLARERGFYGFLAADEIGQPYALEEFHIEADETAIVALADVCVSFSSPGRTAAAGPNGKRSSAGWKRTPRRRQRYSRDAGAGTLAPLPPRQPAANWMP